jgi:site-specific recombinase XerD
MGCSINAVIKPNGHTNKSNLYPIYLRVTIDRKTAVINISEKYTLPRVRPSEWTGKYGKWIKNSVDGSFAANGVIQDKIEEVRKFIWNASVDGGIVTIQDIIKQNQNRNKFKTFNEYVEHFNITAGNFQNDNTRKKYVTLQLRLKEFNSAIPFNKLSPELIYEVHSYFLNEKKYRVGTVKRYLSAFGRICKSAKKAGLIREDPFTDITLRYPNEEANKKTHLSITQIDQIKNCALPDDRPDLIYYRDIFLFTCYSGIYYSDIRELPWHWIINYESGNVIKGKRAKNGNSYITPIWHFLDSERILRNQKGRDDMLVFPETISDVKYNLKLKEIASFAGILDKITAKTGRDSFTQYMVADVGLKLEFVQKMLGHKSPDTIKHYFSIENEDLSRWLGKNHG